MENLFKKRKERISIFQQSRNKIIYTKVKQDIPDHIFLNCNHCNASLPSVEFEKELYVCPRCGYHMKLNAFQRINLLCDENSFKEMDSKLNNVIIEEFKGYEDKLSKYRKSTGLKEAVVCGTCKINGFKCVIAVMDSHFMMGSMGAIVGEKITRAIEYAHHKSLPLIISCTSGGARMQEGIISLMQMAKTSAAIKSFSDDGNFYISLLTNPTTGGVSASFAMLGDIIISEPDALIGFAGKRVIEKTMNQTLPKEFQHAEFVMDKGFVDMIVERKDLKKTIGDLLALHGGKN